MAFSVPYGVKLPPSLKNIYKELHTDLGIPDPKNGDLLWGTQSLSLAVCTDPDIQTDVEICSDGDSGAYIGWIDLRNANDDIYAQYVDGTTQWQTNGKAICTVTESQDGARLCSDYEGGVYITWDDYRNLSVSGNDIFGQHLYPNGTLYWNSDGEAIVSHPNNQWDQQICTDGENGLIIVLIRHWLIL